MALLRKGAIVRAGEERTEAQVYLDMAWADGRVERWLGSTHTIESQPDELVGYGEEVAEEQAAQVLFECVRDFGHDPLTTALGGDPREAFAGAPTEIVVEWHQTTPATEAARRTGRPQREPARYAGTKLALDFLAELRTNRQRLTELTDGHGAHIDDVLRAAHARLGKEVQRREDQHHRAAEFFEEHGRDPADGDDDDEK